MRPVERVLARCLNCARHFPIYPIQQGKVKFCSFSCRSIPVLERFLRTGWTVMESGCWHWNGKFTPKRYGYVSGPNKSFIASRLSWEYHFGPIPHGLFALHSCDNPPCVNPDHLFLGTKADNNWDMHKKGRDRQLIGEDHPMAVLTIEKVKAIRSEPDGPGITTLLGAQYGVSPSTIAAVRDGKTWRHVD